MQYELRPPARLSITSLAALAVAAASFAVSCDGHGAAGLAIACIGMVFGCVAFLRAHSRGVRDAALCLVAIALSVLALVPAIAVMITHAVRHP